MDLVTVLGLSFEYVLPVALALPNVEVVQSLVALGILLFLAFVQLFFVPMIAFMLDFPAEGG